MEEIKSAVTKKYEFEDGDEPMLTTSSYFWTIKILIQGTETTFLTWKVWSEVRSPGLRHQRKEPRLYK